MPLEIPWLMQGSVSDEDGGAVMCLSFLQSRDEVLLVGTHSDLSNIDIAISHGDGAQIPSCRFSLPPLAN